MKIEKIKKLSSKKLSEISNKSEETIQMECVNWFRSYIDGVIFSVPNEATRNSSRFVKTGVLRGASDLVVVLNDNCLFIEMKDYKGTQSKSQKTFQKNIERLGFKYYLIRTLKDFKQLIINYDRI